MRLLSAFSQIPATSTSVSPARWLWTMTVLAGLGTCTNWLPAAGPVSFNFNLAAAQSTSAGVYLPDGTLVRTLWSAISTSAGPHAAEWDGTNDFGNLMPDGPYVIKLLASRCTYTWEGVIGNSSASFTGRTV